MSFFADVALGKCIKLITVFLIVALLAGTVLAQGGSEVIVSVEVDRETTSVGDRIVYTVRAEHDKDLVIDFSRLLHSRLVRFEASWIPPNSNKTLTLL